MMSFSRILLVDVDDTLADTTHRDYLLPDGAIDHDQREELWDAYYSRSIHDAPLMRTIQLVNDLALSGWTCVAFTGRPEKWREITWRWLGDHVVKVHGLHMRPPGNHMGSPELKVHLARLAFQVPSTIPLRMRVGLVIDDRDDVCRAFRDLGIEALRSTVKTNRAIAGASR